MTQTAGAARTACSQNLAALVTSRVSAEACARDAYSREVTSRATIGSKDSTIGVCCMAIATERAGSVLNDVPGTNDHGRVVQCGQALVRAVTSLPMLLSTASRTTAPCDADVPLASYRAPCFCRENTEPSRPREGRVS